MKLLHHPILRASALLSAAHHLLLVSAQGSPFEDDNKDVNEYEKYNCANPNANNNAMMNQCFCGLLGDRNPADSIASAADVSIQATTLCTDDGYAGPYPCNNVDLLSFVPNTVMNALESNDVWGWTDPVTGREFAIIGNYEGTSFIEITDPEDPVYLGKLLSHNNINSSWRDIKTYGHYAFIVSEASSHGMQVFDLNQLLTIDPTSVATIFSADARYSSGVGNLHNIFINEDSATAYLLGGTNSCSGGLHMVDISNPLIPVQSGCYSGDGYTHDVQCVIYNGPDTQYVGNEICFAFNEDTVTIVDVTDKADPVQIKKVAYDDDGYTHQGWLSDDHRYVVFGDETDEQAFDFNTKTLVVDAETLAGAQVIGFHLGSTAAIDHNQYIMGDYIYQANYRAGMQVLKVNSYSPVDFEQVAFFDVYPASNSNSFNGAWSVYPFFPSGTVVISGIEQGLFVTRVDLSPQPSRSPITSAPTPPTPSPTPFNGKMAVYDVLIGAPRCNSTGRFCSSGILLDGRSSIEGLGPESNAPNTLDSCADGSSGTYHNDESNDKIVVLSDNGFPLKAGGLAVIEATTWVWGTADDAADFYYTADISTTPITWTFINTVVPSAVGSQTLESEPFELFDSAVQAVRVNFRYKGVRAACPIGNFDDTDDLVFAVEVDETSPKPSQAPTPPPTTPAPVTPNPSKIPTDNPTLGPSKAPTYQPTESPVTLSPTTSDPTVSPSESPDTSSPSKSPSLSPVTSSPTDQPTDSPVTKEPSKAPTDQPSGSPVTQAPSKAPITQAPSKFPTSPPTPAPSKPPTNKPTEACQLAGIDDGCKDDVDCCSGRCTRGKPSNRVCY